MKCFRNGLNTLKYKNKNKRQMSAVEAIFSVLY